jgi:hypothetical protein
VLGWASSPEPGEPSPFKPGYNEGLKWAWAWLEISEAQAWGSGLGFKILSFSGSADQYMTGKVGGMFWVGILDELK